ncbi:MAG: HAMP domain-containing histidine kinase [Pirellulaceae bacterium]|nr:HAMP domain-containing histidine kinase [Pirellulaceae bacterium]
MTRHTLNDIHFSAETWHQLVGLLLRSLSADSPQYLDVAAKSHLADLARSDADCAAWLCHIAIPADAGGPLGTVDDRRGRVPTNGRLPSVDGLLTWNEAQFWEDPIAWDDLLGALGSLPQNSPQAQPVRQAAHTALRLRGMQRAYASQLEHEKCEVLYQLAYGLSHELNNPLANIAARAGVLLEKCHQHSDRLLLESILDSALRGAEMLGDLMLVARTPQLRLEDVDLAEFGSQVQQRGADWARLRQVHFDCLWQLTDIVSLDRRLLEEVIWAVLRNALEASLPGQTVRLTAGRSDNQLTVQIDDQGAGLSQQALKHCFDPYYSGREAGRGLGLGLTKARRLAQIHRGHVKLANRATGGCRASVVVQLGTW